HCIVAIRECRIAAAEVCISLPRRSIRDALRDADWIHDLQRVPKRSSFPEHSHRLGVAEVRVHVHESDLASEVRRGFGAPESLLDASVVPDRLIDQARTVRK